MVNKTRTVLLSLVMTVTMLQAQATETKKGRCTAGWRWHYECKPRHLVK